VGVLQSGFISKGSKVAEFEENFSAYIGAKISFTTSSGTSALALALKALSIKKGDEVILPTYVCHEVLQAVYMVGADPVLCDIGEEWNMTLETVQHHVSTRTKAIVLVHIFGIPAETESFKALNVPIIEDACQAIGAKRNGKKAGAMGPIGIFSFNAIKCFTTGEGGAVSCNDEEMSSLIDRLVENASVPSIMTDIQAALGISQLNRYKKMLGIRKELAKNYLHELSDLNLVLPTEIFDKSIFFRFPVRLVNMDFDVIRNKFERKGIHVRRGVDALLHRNMKLPDEEFPNASQLFNETLSLPIYPALSITEQDSIIQTAKEIFGS